MGVRIGAHNGLNFASALAQGVGNFVSSYNQTKNQNLQMALKAREIDAEAQLRQLQMQKLQQEIAPVQFDVQKLAVMKRALDAGVLPDSVYNKQVSNTVQNIDSPAKLSVVNQAIDSHLNQKASAFGAQSSLPDSQPAQPSESPASFSLSPKEAEFYSGLIKGQNQYNLGVGRLDLMQKQNDLQAALKQQEILAGIQKNARDNETKKYVAEQNAVLQKQIMQLRSDLGIKVANINAGARIGSATISAGSRGGEKDLYAKNLLTQISDINKAIAKTQARTPGIAELPNQKSIDVAALKQQLADKNNEYQEYIAGKSRASQPAKSGQSQPIQAVDTTNPAPKAPVNARPKFVRGPGIAEKIKALPDHSELELDGQVYVKNGDQIIPR